MGIGIWEILKTRISIGEEWTQNINWNLSLFRNN